MTIPSKAKKSLMRKPEKQIFVHRDGLQESLQKSWNKPIPVKRLKAFRRALLGMKEKFFDLVWWARSDTPERLAKSNIDKKMKARILAARQRVEKNYPADIEKLYNNPDWQDGFNSGCLAAFRWASTAMFTKPEFGGIEEADNDFPMLDS